MKLGLKKLKKKKFVLFIGSKKGNLIMVSFIIDSDF